jgi:hypothetical protein
MTIDTSPTLPLDRPTRKALRRSLRLAAPVLGYALGGAASLMVWGAIFVILAAFVDAG